MPREFADPYTYPGTRVLRNIPGIRDDATLRDFEYEQTKLRIEELRDNPIPGKFDLEHLKAIHAHVFQDVYEWAGQTRTVSISKNGDSFAQPAFIESYSRQLSTALAKENNLQGLEKPQFVERIAHFYADWNALHPFREGNGRTTRELIGQIAREAGYDLDQTRIDNSKDQWNDAARRSFHGDLAPVKEILTEAIRPSRVIAFENLPEAEACAKFPELRRAFDGLRAIEDLARASMAGSPERIAGYMQQVRGEFTKRLEQGQLLDRTREPEQAQARAPAREQGRDR
ncbi:cell filamentation protein [Rhodoferax ferrireducens]|uniref:protein adenylyltransferase n=1 Tax=Rhodoferax ferrireducens TaxID=192843 RepID=A0ABU2CGX8_9BURK|nr:Fic family protein [Rhodoferax ferrireducens]MDR7380447.1 cell filamentation protein [Rhodoferax ferrireducens]